MEKLFNVKLDTTSEYVCNPRKWPKACCDVMVESEEITTMMGQVLGIDDPDYSGYTDIYAVIDPERFLVTEFLVVFKYEDGKQAEMTIKVSSPASSVHYYKTFEEQGGDEFKKFIQDSCGWINGERMEYRGSIIDDFDDFLEEKDVRIPSSDEEMKEDGEWNEDGDNATRIYGTDYDTLASSVSDTLHISKECALKDRIDALIAYYSEEGDEHDYYEELIEIGVTADQIEKWYGRSQREVTEEYWKEHGLI